MPKSTPPSFSDSDVSSYMSGSEYSGSDSSFYKSSPRTRQQFNPTTIRSKHGMKRGVKRRGVVGRSVPRTGCAQHYSSSKSVDTSPSNDSLVFGQSKWVWVAGVGILCLGAAGLVTHFYRNCNHMRLLLEEKDEQHQKDIQNIQQQLWSARAGTTYPQRPQVVSTTPQPQVQQAQARQAPPQAQAKQASPQSHPQPQAQARQPQPVVQRQAQQQTQFHTVMKTVGDIMNAASTLPTSSTVSSPTQPQKPQQQQQQRAAAPVSNPLLDMVGGFLNQVVGGGFQGSGGPLGGADHVIVMSEVSDIPVQGENADSVVTVEEIIEPVQKQLPSTDTAPEPVPCQRVTELKKEEGEPVQLTTTTGDTTPKTPKVQKPKAPTWKKSGAGKKKKEPGAPRRVKLPIAPGNPSLLEEVEQLD